MIAYNMHSIALIKLVILNLYNLKKGKTTYFYRKYKELKTFIKTI